MDEIVLSRLKIQLWSYLVDSLVGTIFLDLFTLRLGLGLEFIHLFLSKTKHIRRARLNGPKRSPTSSANDRLSAHWEKSLSLSLSPLFTLLLFLSSIDRLCGVHLLTAVHRDPLLRLVPFAIFLFPLAGSRKPERIEPYTSAVRMKGKNTHNEYKKRASQSNTRWLSSSYRKLSSTPFTNLKLRHVRPDKT